MEKKLQTWKIKNYKHIRHETTDSKEKYQEVKLTCCTVRNYFVKVRF